jgi:hypothetical protein
MQASSGDAEQKYTNYIGPSMNPLLVNGDGLHIVPYSGRAYYGRSMGPDAGQHPWTGNLHPEEKQKANNFWWVHGAHEGILIPLHAPFRRRLVLLAPPCLPQTIPASLPKENAARYPEAESALFSPGRRHGTAIGRWAPAHR